MTDLERMAWEAGMTAAVYDPFMWAASPKQLARLAALIRADERERWAERERNIIQQAEEYYRRGPRIAGVNMEHDGVLWALPIIESGVSAGSGVTVIVGSPFPAAAIRAGRE